MVSRRAPTLPEAGGIERITIIGSGRLAVGLGRLWASAGILRVADVLGRSAASAERAVEAIGAGRAVSDYARLGPADLFLIATPDRALYEASAALAASGVLNSGSIVFHCSGAATRAELAPAGASGAALASAHPVMSFSQTPVSAAAFVGVVCAIEGEPRAAALVSRIFAALGARTVGIEPEQKMLYHAAAVFGSNYLVTLLSLALRSYGLAGIEPELGLTMLGPLVRQTLENVLTSGPEAALTGPLARGDLEFVREQYRALKARDSTLAAVYRQLAAQTARLAGRADPLD